MFFTIRINFWDISSTYLFFFNIQNIYSNCWIIFHKNFPIIYFYSFQFLFLFINVLLFETLSRHDSFLHNLMQPLPHIENIYHLHLLDLRRINIWTITSRIYFMTFLIYQLGYFKNKILLIDVSKILWHLERSDRKSSSTTAFASM